MARTDAIVLGAGIVGTSVALHLVKRGLERGAGRPPRARRGHLLRQCRRDRGQHAFSPPVPVRTHGAVAGRLKQATEANYHLAFLPQVAPWLWPTGPIRAPSGGMEFADRMRPAVCARRGRARDADGGSRCRALSAQGGWLKLYRTERASRIPSGNASWRRDSTCPVACSIARRRASSSLAGAGLPQRGALAAAPRASPIRSP